jgi:DNA-directed RNA polymerase specialized sigma24 family protein
MAFRLSDRPEYLAPEETASDAAERIMSILPFLTGRARRWIRCLPGRARAQLDVEDVLQELWLKLLAEDQHFDPTRSQYVTWASVVVDRRLQRLGDQLCRGPRPMPLVCDLSDDRLSTPIESIVAAENRQRAREAVAGVIERLDDRHHAVVCFSYGLDGVETKTITEQAAWFVESPSRIIGIRTEAENQLRLMLAG